MQYFPPCSFYSIQFRGIEYIHNAKLLSLASTSWWMGLFLSYEKKLYTHYRQRCCSVTQLCPTLCNCMDYSIPGFLVLHHLPEFAQTHVHWAGDAIQPSHPLSFPSPAFNLSQHQGFFQWVSSSHHVAKVLELQLQLQAFQRIFRVDSFRIDQFDLLAVEQTFKSLLHLLKNWR